MGEATPYKQATPTKDCIPQICRVGVSRMAKAESIERVKSLRAFASSLRGATERWAEKYRDRSHYDKQGFAFTYRTDAGWNAFNTPALGFEAFVGTYGSSSCSNAWSVNSEHVKRFLLPALNHHKQAIFDTMAALAEKEAGELRASALAELDALRALIEEAEAEQVAA